MREGGELLDTVDFGRGAFSCTLSRADDPTLYVVGEDFGAPEDAGPTGVVGASRPRTRAPDTRDGTVSTGIELRRTP